MPINSISRQVNTLALSATATLGPDVDQVVANATSAGFTITLCDFSDGALHQVEIVISPSDSSGNTVSISGNAGAFTTSLSSSGTTSAMMQTQTDGTWFVVGDVSSVSAGAANSRAVSAGLAASTADSKAVSDSVVISTNLTTVNSAVASGSLNTSTADSKAVSDSVVISTLTTTANSKDTSSNLRISIVASTANSA